MSPRALIILAVLALVTACPLAAQGTIAGSVIGTLEGTPPARDATVLVLALPEDSAPFNEITSATWQQAMDAFAAGEQPQTPFGSLAGNMPPTGIHTAVTDADGSFRLEGLPLEARLAVAAKVGDLWWPLPAEQWLTPDAPDAEVELEFYPVETTHEGVRILEWRLEADVQMRGDLHFAPLALVETLRVENLNTDRGVLVEIALDIAVPPRLLARHLPALYGSELMVMHGDNSRPVYAPQDGGALAAQAWRFGGADFMHGTRASYNQGPQRSADTWHMLNESNLAITGVGDTLFIDQPSPAGRHATIVFRRVVPPARDGAAGVLELRVRHRGGVEAENVAGRFQLKRAFPLTVYAATARVRDSIHLQALVEGTHRRLYAEPQLSGAVLEYAAHAESLPASEQVTLVFGLTTDAQARFRELSEAFMQQGGTPPVLPDTGRRVALHSVFKALAIMFGLAFLAALVATLRKPREQQLEVLAKLPHTRAELLAALAQMEADFKAGKLPAGSWLEQKQRLLNRLIELEVKPAPQPETKDE